MQKSFILELETTYAMHNHAYTFRPFSFSSLWKRGLNSRTELIDPVLIRFQKLRKYLGTQKVEEEWKRKKFVWAKKPVATGKTPL